MSCDSVTRRSQSNINNRIPTIFVLPLPRTNECLQFIFTQYQYKPFSEYTHKLMYYMYTFFRYINLHYPHYIKRYIEGREKLRARHFKIRRHTKFTGQKYSEKSTRSACLTRSQRNCFPQKLNAAASLYAAVRGKIGTKSRTYSPAIYIPLSLFLSAKNAAWIFYAVALALARKRRISGGRQRRFFRHLGTREKSGKVDGRVELGIAQDETNKRIIKMNRG